VILVQCRNRTRSQPAEITQLFSGWALSNAVVRCVFRKRVVGSRLRARAARMNCALAHLGLVLSNSQDHLDHFAPALKPAIRPPMRNKCRKLQLCRGRRSRLAPRTDRTNSASSVIVPPAINLVHRTSETSTCSLDLRGISFRRTPIRRDRNGRDHGRVWNRVRRFALLGRNPRPTACRNLPRSILTAHFRDERLRYPTRPRSIWAGGL
jgi:hypothetical protein